MDRSTSRDWLAYRASLYGKSEAELKAAYEAETVRGRKAHAGLCLLAAHRAGYDTWNWGLKEPNA